MVKKIIDYEAKRQPGLWQGRLMQVADNEMQTTLGTTYLSEPANNSLRNIFPVDYDTRKVYLRQIGSPERTNQAILTTIDEGDSRRRIFGARWHPNVGG